jgi:hypothetical protein
MGRVKKGIFDFVMIGCIGSASFSLPVLAAGDGTIVIERTVQPHVATRPLMRPDPNPTAVSANPSGQVNGALANSELTDGDFASVSSGATINHLLMPGGTLSGLNTVSRGLPGVDAGHSGGAVSGISSQVTSAVQQGLAPLRMLSGDR